jgi:hypothetical protein
MSSPTDQGKRRSSKSKHHRKSRFPIPISNPVTTAIHKETDAIKKAGFTLGKADAVLELVHDAAAPLTKKSTRMAVESEVLKSFKGGEDTGAESSSAPADGKKGKGLTDQQKAVAKSALQVVRSAKDAIHTPSPASQGGLVGELMAQVDSDFENGIEGEISDLLDRITNDEDVSDDM